MYFTVNIKVGDKVCFITMSEDKKRIEKCYKRLVDFHRSVVAFSVKELEVSMTKWDSPLKEKLIKSEKI